MSETIEDMEKFVKERKEFFMKNVFPITDRIASALMASDKVNNDSIYCDWGLKIWFKYNGVKIEFKSNDRIGMNPSYNMLIKYKWKKVLKYMHYRTTHSTTLDVFHECEWIGKLDGLVEKIRREDAEWKKKRALKKYSKRCKNLTSECAVDE